jgi:tetratricopeptide (TPR) repeat protein
LELGGAEKEFQRAIALNPGYATAHQWYGEYLISLGRFEEAKAELNRALELNPVSLAINIAQGFPYFYAREYDQAVAAYQQTLELHPNSSLPHSWLALAYEQKGMFDQAVAEYLDEDKSVGRSIEAMEAAKRAYEASGIKGFLQARLIPRLVADAPSQTNDSKYTWALTYTRLGEKEKAFKCLQQAYANREHGLAQSLKVHPIFDVLRDDPRFAELLRHVGLAP